MKVTMSFGLAAMLFAVTIVLSGCSNEKAVGDKNAVETNAAASIDDHSGWWCTEHAIPEEECSLCSAKVATECKENGDWCEEHNRAKSQCFKCDPSLADKYARLYEAKYGKKPPAARE